VIKENIRLKLTARRRRSSFDIKPAKEFKVFQDSFGMVGIAPVEARVEDIVCHFLYCDAAGLIRLEGNRYIFVGRILVFKREGCSATRLDEYTSKTFKYHVLNEADFPARIHSISFYVDVATLQLLAG